MDKKVNDLQEIINGAYHNLQPKKLGLIIRLIYNRVDLRRCQISKNDIEKLNKVGLRAEDVESSFLVGLIYNLIFTYKLIQTEDFDPNGVLTIVNVLLPIYERIAGTILAKRVVIHIKNLLINLIKRPELRGEDKAQIFSLLTTSAIRQDNVYTTFDNVNEVKEIKELLKSQLIYDKVNGVMNLINTFSSCTDLEEQLDVFTKKLPNLLKKALVDINEKGKDFLELVGHIAECMLFQCEFLVKVNKEAFKASDNTNESDPLLLYFTGSPITETKEEDPQLYDILPYRITEQEANLKACDNIYPSISFIIEAFLKFPKNIELQKICVRILQRLYYMFPKFRKNMEEHIITVFSNINEDPNDINKKDASAFLYKLVHRDAGPEFRQHLTNRESFQTLYKVAYYDASLLTNKENLIESVSINDLSIQAGFPHVHQIPAGNSHSTFIEVWKPWSILYWSFALTDYDIGFTLTKVASLDKMIQEKPSQPTVIINKDKIEASKFHCRGSLLVKEPGIYKIDFNNTHSWFNAKELKYLVFVLEPDFSLESLMTGNKSMESLGSEEGSSSKTDNHFDANKQPTNKVLSAYGGLTEIDTFGVIYINTNAIEFSIKNKDKGYEIMISYKPGEIDWDQVNERILETTKKVIEIGRTSIENKISLKIIYDEKAIKDVFGYEPKSHHRNSQRLLSIFTCIEKLHDNILGHVEVKNQVEYVSERLLDSKHFGPNDNIYAVCLNNFAKSFHSKYRCKNKEQKAFDFNNLCIPDTTGPTNEGWQVKSISELYFGSELSNKKVSYLASLLINIYNYYNGEISQFLIFEDRDSSILLEENQEKIREVFKNYVLKKYGEAKEDGKKEHVEEGADHNARKPTEIVFFNVKMQDYMKL